MWERARRYSCVLDSAACETSRFATSGGDWPVLERWAVQGSLRALVDMESEDLRG